jgi:uncharacterized protein
LIRIGEYNVLEISREKPIGVFLDDGNNGILLPGKYVPKGVRTGDRLKVFVYHDSEDRLIATTELPFGVLGDIVKLRVVNTTYQGAFLDWGLAKDLFVPRSKQISYMRPNGEYIIKIMMDEKTGRLYGTEKFESFLSNEHLAVKDLEEVNMLVYRRTNLGYVVIINNQHTGLLHFNEVYRHIEIGDRFPGFIKKITRGKGDTDFKIDVVAGKPGYQRVEDESQNVLRLLEENKGLLPYDDKSSPEDVYAFFGMSKRTFKMTIGKLYRERKIVFTDSGIELSK